MIRTCIFDIYKTLVRVHLEENPSEDRWRILWRDQLHSTPRITLADLRKLSRAIVLQKHQEANKQGILYPEIQWPMIMNEAIPELSYLSVQAHDSFIREHLKLSRSLSLEAACAECLVSLRQAQIPMGLASNAQEYTLKELNILLQKHGLDLSLFDPHLVFLSYEHGFSKPDPYAFRILNSRLEARGLQAQEVLMVGDRFDNDIGPASALGWNTWQLTDESTEATANSGPWNKFRSMLQDTLKLGHTC